MSGRLRIGIRGRLFLAFGAVAAMTVAASVIGWISYARLGSGLDRVVRTNIPAMQLVTELAEKGAIITGMAPALAVAPDEPERERIWRVLSQNLKRMDTLLGTVGVPVPSAALVAQGKLAELIAALTSTLRELDENVRRRLWYRRQKDELAERLRLVWADFLDEVEPMLDDTRFNIEVRLAQAASSIGSILIAGGSDAVRAASVNQQALYRINADGNLLVGLISRAANLPDAASLRPTEFYLREIQDRVEKDLKIVAGVSGSLSLRQGLEDILAFAEGEKSLFGLRGDELETLARGNKLLERNRQQVAKLGRLTAARVQAANTVALAATAKSQTSIRQGKVLMLATVGASLVFTGLIVWLYVGRNMVGRITRLDAAMYAIAHGNLKADVPVEGTDEIGDMAVALRTFRDRLASTQAELVQAGKLAALGQLSAGIAHEINQPLSAIRHYARNGEKFLEQGRDGEVKGNLTKISELTERVRQIVTRLKSMARKPSAGPPGSGLKEVDLAEVVDNVLVLLEASIRECGGRVSVNLDTGCTRVLAGPVRLEQVLLNVLGNAADAIRNSRRKTIAVSSARIEGMIELTIEDSGPGIDPEKQDQIFDPFFTTKNIGEGLGLGLSISYNIIKDFGGSMTFSSTLGECTAFRIRLKAASRSAEA